MDPNTNEPQPSGIDLIAAEMATTIMRDLDVIHPALDLLRKLTPEHIAYAERKMKDPQPSEKVLGAIRNETARRIYTVATVLSGMSVEAAAKANAALNEIDEAEQHHLQHKLDGLADLMRDLFWLQARADMGQLKCGLDSNVGIRKGWMLVSFGDDPRKKIADVLRGLGLPGTLLEIPLKPPPDANDND